MHHVLPMNANLPSMTTQRGSVGRMMLVVLAIVGALASIEFYALHQSGRIRAPSAASPPTSSAAPAAAIAKLPAGVIGAVDTPAAGTIVGDRLQFAGWALAPGGIRAVDIVVDGKPYAAHYGLARNDVAAVKPDYPAAASSGFSFEGDFAQLTPQRHDVTVVATAKDGAAATLARKSLVSPAALSMWKDVAAADPAFAQRPFWFLMATSGVAQQGASGIETQYQGLTSATMRVGMSIPILYMRTTRGPAGDFAFDPDFDLSRKCGKRAVADDNLRGVIDYAIAHHLPVNFILNGGIWGDASCESRQWDLTDHLQLDEMNCQWDQSNTVFPDDYRKGLTGSTDSPLLSRSLTYNVYARSVRDYKRRNLTAAAKVVARFAREHPELFVGINLDADTYMNPFVQGGHRYDYNPGMLRQFREWLAGTGPYAGHPSDGAPDLSYYRRKTPLTLAQVNRMAGKHWSKWSEVDPPRQFPGGENYPVGMGETPFWQDPWYLAWDAFRKHIIQLHYDELAQWTHEAGVPADRIFTAQAFTAADPGLRPISTFIDGESPDYDSAGVSIEGAKPRIGHLGAILYGPSVENEPRMETDRSLFAAIARFDTQWAVAESNATDLKQPQVLPTYARSYRSFRDLFNYGGRQIALMAWNGSNGIFAGKPGYVAYTSWRNTPAEQAMMDFLVSHAGLPQGALLWTFGSPRLVDDDGWTAMHGTVQADHGALVMHPSGDRLTLRSPPDQVIRPSRIGRLMLRLEGAAKINYAVVYAKGSGEDRPRIIARARDDTITLDWPADWLRNDTVIEQLELELAFAPGADGSRLTRVLLYPAAVKPGRTISMASGPLQSKR